LVAQPGGLLVEVTDGTADYNAQHYRISVFYDLVKQSVNRLAFSQGHELGPHGATPVAITPGWLRSEMMLENFGRHRNKLARGADGAGRRQATGAARFRAVGSRRAMSAAPWRRSPPIPDRGKWNQKSVSSGELARHYGFTDIDGSRPDIWRYTAEVREGGKVAELRDYR
jgi:NAD(P)-dependent dehydrogenase (short-subunit alcohol dehydrogenase family)